MNRILLSLFVIPLFHRMFQEGREGGGNAVAGDGGHAGYDPPRGGGDGTLFALNQASVMPKIAAPGSASWCSAATT